MKLGNNLFVKMFLGFWLATIAILGTWLIAAHYFESMPSAGAGHPVHGTPPQFMLRLHYKLENLPMNRLQAYVRGTERRHGIRIWLFDARQRELFGRPAPPGVIALADQLRGPTRRATRIEGRERLLAFKLYRPELGPVRSVVAMPGRPPHRIVRLLGDNPWIRLGLAIGVSGVICYLLSRLMTRRIKQLQRATRQLAAGDLQARIPVPAGGGDETEQLARDFNTMAQELEQRVDSQKQLLRDVSHELRSPLARLRIALALAQNDPANSALQLTRIERDTGRLETLIDQLLAAERENFDAGGQVDLICLLKELCSDADFEARPGEARPGEARPGEARPGEARPDEARVSLHIGPSEAFVAGSADLLRRCFDNILRNALNYSDGEVAVQLTQAAESGDFEVRIADAGPGVPDGELARIFDTFYRIDEARSRESGGYGLGLAIARRAIEQHGGTITAKNLHPGLVIIARLPRACSDASPVSQSG